MGLFFFSLQTDNRLIVDDMGMVVMIGIVMGVVREEVRVEVKVAETMTIAEITMVEVVREAAKVVMVVVEI
jgi:hypothetical protein